MAFANRFPSMESAQWPLECCVIEGQAGSEVRDAYLAPKGDSFVVGSHPIQFDASSMKGVPS